MLRFKRNKFTIIDLVLRWIEVISVTVNSLVHVYKKFLPFVRSWICLSAWPLYHLHILYQHLVTNCFHKHYTLALCIFMQSGEEEKREYDERTESFNCVWANTHAISWRRFCGYSQRYESTKTCHWNSDFLARHSLWKFMMNASVFLLSWINNWRGVWNKALSDFWCNVKFS